MNMEKQKTGQLSEEQGQVLVRLARQMLLAQLGGQPDLRESQTLEAALREDCFKESRGTFVCLKIDSQLRGCIGNLTGDGPIAEGVRQNVLGAAFHDPRFMPLAPEELPLVRIEVSVLTEPRPLAYREPTDLICKIRPGVDGVIIRQGLASATFLPQVWEQLPQPEIFLSNLCRKAGLPSEYWRHSPLDVMIYQAQYFAEK
jgi:AmmeMemoRadiSam system protein A